MTALILGPNGSGKSAYAERLAASLGGGPLVYIATMLPYGEQGRLRVEKHIAQRRGYGFVTVEAPYTVADMEVDARSTVLLEDLSNLLGNAVFEKKERPENVLDGILALSEKCANLVIVSIDGLVDGDGGDAATREYIKSLNSINGAISKWADKTIRMREGSPYEDS